MTDPIAQGYARYDARIDQILERRANRALFQRIDDGTGTFRQRGDLAGRYIPGSGGTYVYNTGTDRRGRYVPGYDIGSDGTVTRTYLNPSSAAPSTSNLTRRQAILHLDLTSNPDGTYSRNGFVGTYHVAENGTVFFAGGHHRSRPGVPLPPQTYINGRWYAGDHRPRTTTPPQVTPPPTTPPRVTTLPPITLERNGGITLENGERIATIQVPGASRAHNFSSGPFTSTGGFSIDPSTGAYTFEPGHDHSRPGGALGNYTLTTTSGRTINFEVRALQPTPPPLVPLPTVAPITVGTSGGLTTATNGRINLPPGVTLSSIQVPGAGNAHNFSSGPFQSTGGFSIDPNTGDYTFAPGFGVNGAVGNYTLTTNDGRTIPFQVRQPLVPPPPLVISGGGPGRIPLPSGAQSITRLITPTNPQGTSFNNSFSTANGFNINVNGEYSFFQNNQAGTEGNYVAITDNGVRIPFEVR